MVARQKLYNDLTDSRPVWKVSFSAGSASAWATSYLDAPPQAPAVVKIPPLLPRESVALALLTASHDVAWCAAVAEQLVLPTIGLEYLYELHLEDPKHPPHTRITILRQLYLQQRFDFPNAEDWDEKEREELEDFMASQHHVEVVTAIGSMVGVWDHEWMIFSTALKFDDIPLNLEILCSSRWTPRTPGALATQFQFNNREKEVALLLREIDGLIEGDCAYTLAFIWRHFKTADDDESSDALTVGYAAKTILRWCGRDKVHAQTTLWRKCLAVDRAAVSRALQEHMADPELTDEEKRNGSIRFAEQMAM